MPLNTGINSFDPSDVILYVFCFILPPFSVMARKGWRSGEFWASCLLTMFFHLPGLFYSLYIVYTTSPVTGDNTTRDRYTDVEQGAAEGFSADTSPLLPAAAGPSVSDSRASRPQGESPPAYGDHKIQLPL